MPFHMRGISSFDISRGKQTLLIPTMTPPLRLMSGPRKRQ